MEIKAYFNGKDEIEYEINEEKIGPLELAAFFIFATKEQVEEKLGKERPDVIVLDPTNKKLIKAAKQINDGLDYVYKK